MTYINKTLHFGDNVVLSGVTKLGTRGCVLQFTGQVEGRKDITDYNISLNLNHCEMTSLGEEFHSIMDKLMDEWVDAKKRISGTRAKWGAPK